MSNQTQTLEQMIKRIVGAAFDAGVQAATRPRAERDRQRIDQADFAAVMIRGQVNAERLKATTDQLEADFLGKVEAELNGARAMTSTVAKPPANMVERA
jgi:hypothetical protein